MKTYVAFSISIFVLAAVISAHPPQTQSYPPSLSDVEELEKRIAFLENKVRDMEAELKELKRWKKYVVIARKSLGLKSIPPEWKPYRYDGETYYLIPLESFTKSKKERPGHGRQD